jgi:hypothetical protein
MDGSHAKLTELLTRNEFKNAPTGDTGLISPEALKGLNIEDEDDAEGTEAASE